MYIDILNSVNCSESFKQGGLGRNTSDLYPGGT
jgi:hypothetical protein